MELKAKEKVDIVFAIGNTAHGKSKIVEKIEGTLKPSLFESNIDAKVTVIDGGTSTGKYYYDIYDGYTGWSYVTTEQDRTGWTRRYGQSKPPTLDRYKGFTWAKLGEETGYANYDAYTYLNGTYNSGKYTSISEMITCKEYNYPDKEGTGDNGWETIYEVTTTRYRKTLSSYRGSKITSILRNDGALPDNDRIMVSDYEDGLILAGNYSIKIVPDIKSVFDKLISNMPANRENSKKYIVYLVDDSFGHRTTNIIN